MFKETLLVWMARPFVRQLQYAETSSMEGKNMPAQLRYAFMGDYPKRKQYSHIIPAWL
jgi:hypothetical protein